MSVSVIAKILVIDDDPDVHRLMKHMLSKHGFEVFTALTPEEGFKLLREHKPQVIVLDYRLQDCDGLSLLDPIRKISSATPVILMTAHSSVELVVQSMQAGVHDFLPKPIEEARLVAALMKAVEHSRLLAEVAELQIGGEAASFEGIIGKSPEMQTIFRIIENVAPTDVSVMITGESGTGKELIALALHSRSRHARGPWVPLNMAAIPTELVESTLFGHEKGAFTGAEKKRIGACEEADSGTLFLDEITEMPVELQAKLLRFIQERRFRRLGGHVDQEARVRIISATNSDPLTAVQNGKLREDLFYRLNVVPVNLPPLRERNSDIPLIATHMLRMYSEKYKKNFAEIEPRAIQAMMRFSWPGNVRQLCHAIERAVVLNDQQSLKLDMLPQEIQGSPISHRDAAKMAESSAANGHASSSHPQMNSLPPIIPSKGEYETDHQGLTGRLAEDDSQTSASNENHTNVKMTSDNGAAANAWTPARAVDAAANTLTTDDILPIDELEKRAIAQALEILDGSASKAAKRLGISEATIYRKIKQYSLK